MTRVVAGPDHRNRPDRRLHQRPADDIDGREDEQDLHEPHRTGSEPWPERNGFPMTPPRCHHQKRVCDEIVQEERNPEPRRSIQNGALRTLAIHGIRQEVGRDEEERAEDEGLRERSDERTDNLHPHDVMRFREIPRAGSSVGDRGVDQDHHRDEEAAITRYKNDAGGNRRLDHDAAL